MEKQIFIVLTILELQALVAEFLGNPGYDTLMPDMRGRNANPEWNCETYHVFEVVTSDKWITGNHEDHLAEAREKGKVEWDWEIEAILNQLAHDGLIEYGKYLIEGFSD